MGFNYTRAERKKHSEKKAETVRDALSRLVSNGSRHLLIKRACNISSHRSFKSLVLDDR